MDKKRAGEKRRFITGPSGVCRRVLHGAYPNACPAIIHGGTFRESGIMNRRRLFQISLRTLLGLITVAAIWLGYITHRAREQKVAVARIKELGGRVVYDYQAANTAANATPPGWPWLRRLVGDEYFQDV